MQGNGIFEGFQAQEPPEDEHVEYYRVDPRKIGYLSFIIHSYEGMALVRTLEHRKGIVEIILAPDFKDQLHRLLRSLEEELEIRPWPEEGGAGKAGA